jgi:hypothetical protein
MKKSNIGVAIALALGATGVNATTFTFANSTTAQDGSVYACNSPTLDFSAGREFRMCDPTGSLGGGFPTQKDTINGGETWTYTGGVMTATAGMPDTAGVVPAYTAPYPGSSADPAGGAAMDQGAAFFGPLFSFLAPISGSNAANAYGAGTIQNVTATTFELYFPVLEAQWGGVFFPLGQASGGVTFHGTFTGSGGFSMWAEELIDASEDPNGAGFAGWTAQWAYVGTTDLEPVPVPAAVWLFGSGLLGLVGVARRKKSV